MHPPTTAASTPRTEATSGAAPEVADLPAQELDDRRDRAICCIAPTVHHRAGVRTSRSSRLGWAIRLTRIGLVLLAVALMSSVICVSRFVRGAAAAAWIAAALGALLFAAWVALPLLTASRADAPTGHHSGTSRPVVTAGTRTTLGATLVDAAVTPRFVPPANPVEPACPIPSPIPSTSDSWAPTVRSER